jgi:hypothetical protein
MLVKNTTITLLSHDDTYSVSVQVVNGKVSKVSFGQTGRIIEMSPGAVKGIRDHLSVVEAELLNQGIGY